MTRAWFRFYAELNVFVAPPYRQRPFEHACARDASVKHMIEVFGVPHTEVALILVNGEPVDFSYRLCHQDCVSVYPGFLHLGDDAPMPILLQPAGPPAFVADAHMGRLARDLRMLGFDALYRNDFSDDEIVRLAVEENRIVLTRDRDLLMRKPIVRGAYLYSTDSDTQLLEIMRRYRLAEKAKPLSRCLDCNGVLETVSRKEVAQQVPPRSAILHEDFRRCEACGHVYWEGSHVTRMRRRIDTLLTVTCMAIPAN
ncbi:Mut7-C RNAse domain-containing protein [Paucimonas lemoignei]|uniref:Mut7-C RNAse domain-containing protein n=1 Tax=Paucimonas lemoignei TaxID=29443 RepID=UPI001048678A|nr:DUF5615 family PIN-like protein [Paucimonas lemoignei]